jgi:uroporphyrinogen III methyltransferase/synthase
VKRALVARAEEARDVLDNALRARGAEVDVLALYRTVPEPIDGPLPGADYVTFTSGSSVRAFLTATGGIPNGARIVSIGPATSDALREAGVQPDVEAPVHTPDGLVDALVADAASRV